MKGMLVAAVVGLAAGSAYAGPLGESGEVFDPVPPVDPFKAARLPITNAVYNDLAIPVSHARPLFMHQSLPRTLSTIVGNLPVDGDFQLFALQLEFALNDRLAIIAKKDGYINFDPDTTLTGADGWANLAAGLKYAFIRNDDLGLAVAGSFLYEAPTGSSDVWQGKGDGSITPALSVLKLWDAGFQVTGNTGLVIPFDSGENSMTYFASAGVSYELTDWLFPTAEVNYFRVVDEGNGGARFMRQAGGAVPALATFEGGDLVNLGASNAGTNADLVTLGLGFRIRAAENIDIGAAFEFPLTDDSDNLMENRFTLDFVWRF